MDYKIIARDSVNLTDFAKNIGYKYINGTVFRTVKQIIDDNDIDVSHFDRYHSNRARTRWITIEIECPVCGETFKTKKGHPREKTTCSHACSNTFHRTREMHPNWKGGSYRSICFAENTKKCIICGESRMVEVHHFDEDRTNNDVTNLVPLCPTHHGYMHSKHKDVIIDEILEHINNIGE